MMSLLKTGFLVKMSNDEKEAWISLNSLKAFVSTASSHSCVICVLFLILAKTAVYNLNYRLWVINSVKSLAED